jgi:hypothetical protein
MNVGQQIPTTVLATTTTNSAGNYTLEVPVATLQAAAVSSGYANLEVFSAIGGFFFFPYQTGSLPVHPASPVTVNLSQKKGLSCGVDPDGQLYNFTGFFLEYKRAPAYAIVGQGYIVKSSKTRGDKVSFSYTEGSNHSQSTSLGVAISGYGVDAGYNAEGAHSSTAHRSASFPSRGGNALFETQFNTGQYRGICYGPENDNNIPFQKQHGKCPHTIKMHGIKYWVHKCFWMVHSRGWFGGTNIVQPRHAPSTPAPDCASYLKNSNFNNDTGTAVEWTHGWNLGASLGIKGASGKADFNGSAQTGYDTDALMVYHFGHAGWLCGTNGDNDTAAQLVQRGHRA